MKSRGSQELEKQRYSRSIEFDDESGEHVPFEEVLFEVGVVLASHLAVALSVALTLRATGIIPGI